MWVGLAVVLFLNNCIDMVIYLCIYMCVRVRACVALTGASQPARSLQDSHHGVDQGSPGQGGRIHHETPRRDGN